MTLMEQWAIVIEAYKQASIWNLVKRVYKQAKCWFCLLIVSFIWIINMKVQLLKITLFLEFAVLIVIFSCLIVFFERAVKSRYKSYYENEYYHKLIRTYNKDREYLRFLVFKDNLEAMLKIKNEKVNYQQMQIFVNRELDSAQGSIFLRHPLIISLVGIITAVAGGGSSVEVGWTSRITPLILMWVLFILVYSIWFMDLFKTREYKFRELKKFLFWLEQEING